VLYGAAECEAKRRSFQKIIAYVFASDVDTSLIRVAKLTRSIDMS
jgi:hypothetical protein